MWRFTIGPYVRRLPGFTHFLLSVAVLDMCLSKAWLADHNVSHMLHSTIPPLHPSPSISIFLPSFQFHLHFLALYWPYFFFSSHKTITLLSPLSSSRYVAESLGHPWLYLSFHSYVSNSFFSLLSSELVFISLSVCISLIIICFSTSDHQQRNSK